MTCTLLIVRVFSTGGGGEGSTPNSTFHPQKVLNNKSAMRIYNIYTELNQLSDQTLHDIIDKYKYILLNEVYFHPSLAMCGTWQDYPPNKNF